MTGIAEKMREGGYRAHACGKWDAGMVRFLPFVGAASWGRDIKSGCAWVNTVSVSLLWGGCISSFAALTCKLCSHTICDLLRLPTSKHHLVEVMKPGWATSITRVSLMAVESPPMHCHRDGVPGYRILLGTSVATLQLFPWLAFVHFCLVVRHMCICTWHGNSSRLSLLIFADDYYTEGLPLSSIGTVNVCDNK